MVNLIGLIVGRSLAQKADLPESDAARISLLGAASPSPLLGAVLVEAAIRRERRPGPVGWASPQPPAGLMTGGADVLEKVRRMQSALGELEESLTDEKRDSQAAYEFWEEFQQATMQLIQAAEGDSQGRPR